MQHKKIDWIKNKKYRYSKFSDVFFYVMQWIPCIISNIIIIVCVCVESECYPLQGPQNKYRQSSGIDQQRSNV